jgi:hypothetical protein
LDFRNPAQQCAKTLALWIEHRRRRIFPEKSFRDGVIGSGFYLAEKFTVVPEFY